MAFTYQVIVTVCPTAYFSLGSMRSLWLNCSGEWLAKLRYFRLTGPE